MGSFVRIPAGSLSILLAIDCIETTEQGARIVAMIGNPLGGDLSGVSIRIRYSTATPAAKDANSSQVRN
jgi:hypothetical protein